MHDRLTAASLSVSFPEVQGNGRTNAHEGGGVGQRTLGERTRSHRLSGRERRVLAELARGTSTEDIADKLHVSPHTVRTHVKNIMRKLDARTRAHAVAIAITEDAIDAEEV
jgi:DNA-binding CsgD family transcriptional regulator